MRSRQLAIVVTFIALLGLLLTAPGAMAQVATLRTPDPAAEATEPPAEEVDGQEAILEFVACLRDNGVDIPDPQFGVMGGFLSGDFAEIDFMSSEFLDAMEACQALLAAVQPEIDPEQQAEQNEQLLLFAQCMRREGIDFPDPDPIRGLTIASFRSEDGRLTIDPFTSGFLDASSICAAEVGLGTPAGMSP